MDTRPYIALVFAAGAALVGGCSQLPASARQQIALARTALTAGRFSSVEELLSPIIREYSGQHGTAVAYYIRGQSRLYAGAPDSARNDFQAGYRLARDAELRAVIDAQLGNLAFETGDYETACTHYGRAAARLPSNPPTDRVLYQHGVALQRLGRFPQARNQYAQLLHAFPLSEYADAARKRRDWPEPYFAIQCGVFTQEPAARTAAADLRARGLNAQSQPDAGPMSQRYVVRVGRYARYADAARELERVRPLVPDAFIVP